MRRFSVPAALGMRLCFPINPPPVRIWSDKKLSILLNRSNNQFQKDEFEFFMNFLTNNTFIFFSMLKTPGPPLNFRSLAFNYFLVYLTFSWLLALWPSADFLAPSSKHCSNKQHCEIKNSWKFRIQILKLVVGSGEQDTAFGIHYEDANSNRRGVRRPPPSQNLPATSMNSKI